MFASKNTLPFFLFFIFSSFPPLPSSTPHFFYSTDKVGLSSKTHSRFFPCTFVPSFLLLSSNGISSTELIRRALAPKKKISLPFSPLHHHFFYWTDNAGLFEKTFPLSLAPLCPLLVTFSALSSSPLLLSYFFFFYFPNFSCFNFSLFFFPLQPPQPFAGSLLFPYYLFSFSVNYCHLFSYLRHVSLGFGDGGGGGWGPLRMCAGNLSYWFVLHKLHTSCTSGASTAVLSFLST